MDSSIELSTLHTVNSAERPKMDDEASILNMGYKQELYRGFSATMDLAFCFTAVSVLSSIGLLLGYGLIVGGPAVMVWCVPSPCCNRYNREAIKYTNEIIYFRVMFKFW